MTNPVRSPASRLNKALALFVSMPLMALPAAAQSTKVRDNKTSGIRVGQRANIRDQAKTGIRVGKRAGIRETVRTGIRTGEWIGNPRK